MAEPGPLLIGGGGSTSVASEHLLEALDRLARGARTCATAADRLRPLTDPLPGDRWNGTGVELEQTAAMLRRESEALELLGGGLRTAIDAYGWAESQARSWLERVLEPIASTLGFVAGRLVLPLLPGVLPVLGVAAAAWMLLPASSRAALSRSADAGLERVGGRLLDDSTTTATLRVLSTAVDDGVLGLLGVPPALMAQYQAAGVDSVAASAGAALTIGVIASDRGRAPAAVTRVSPPAPVAVPVGIADRVARIPDPARPVTVERHVDARGEEWFEVYIAGTAGAAADGGPLVEGGDHPWDMASNIALIAEQDSSSLQAAKASLADAGAVAESRVVFTGYSQGAAVATRLAESGEYATAGLVTVGAPTGGMPVTGDYPAIVVAHDDDPVTALGGPQQRTEAIVVTAPRGDGWQEGDPIVAGHSLEEYRSTAVRVDDAEAPPLRDAIDRLPGGRDDPAGESVSYTARRLDPDERQAGRGGGGGGF